MTPRRKTHYRTRFTQQISIVPALMTLFAASAFSTSAGQAIAAPPDTAPTAIDPTYRSGTSPLKTAPIDPSDARKAQWIWADTTSNNQTIHLRRTFDLAAAPQSAVLWLTADNRFTLRVNGTEAGHTDPTGGVNVWQKPQKISIAGLLKPGTNTIEIEAFNVDGPAGALAHLDLGPQSFNTDASWQVSDDGANWKPAHVVAPYGEGAWNEGVVGWPSGVDYLAHMTLPVVRLLGTEPGSGSISHADAIVGKVSGQANVTIAPNGAAGEFLVDFGKEIAGRIALTSDTACIASVTTGESVQEVVRQPWHGPQQVIISPNATAYSPYTAFRYAKISLPPANTPSDLKLKLSIAADVKYYPVAYKGSFDCSDPLLTRIWYTGAYTVHLCMQEDIWDAPKRDRARWMGDLHVSGEIINDVFADQFLMEQTLDRLLADATDGKGKVVRHVNGIASYSAAYVCGLADLYRHVGDLAYIKRHHDDLISLMDYVRSDFDDSGRFAHKHDSWWYLDWSPGLYAFGQDGPKPGPDIPNPSEIMGSTHFFFTKAIADASFLLRAIGDNAAADKYAAWDDQALTTGRAMIDPSTGTFGDRLQENAMAIYSGVAGDKADTVYKAIFAPGSPAWGTPNEQPAYNRHVFSPYYGNYILYAMSMAGHNHDALDLMRRYWGGMLDEGATTFWEGYDPRWPKDDPHAHINADNQFGYQASLCHGWSAGPTSWLTDRLLGVRPTSGGFATVDIAPDLGDLTWAMGDIPTPHGPIHIDIHRHGTEWTTTIDLPDGVTASVTAPGQVAKINGQAPASHTGALVLDKGGKYTILSK